MEHEEVEHEMVAHSRHEGAGSAETSSIEAVLAPGQSVVACAVWPVT